MESISYNFNDYTLLKIIPREFLEKCLNENKMQIKKYFKDQIIHFDGDYCDSLQIILLGQAIIERIDENGNLLRVATLYPDNIIGGNLVFSKSPYYPMTVTAKSDSTLFIIRKDELFKLCFSNVSFLNIFLEYISDHALLLGDRIKHYAKRSIRESIIAFLLNENKIQNSNKIVLHISKKSFAESIGVARTSLSRELKKMKNEGLIDYDMNSITIIDFKQLKG